MDQGQVIHSPQETDLRLKTLKDSKLLKVLEYDKVSIAG